MKSSKSNFLFYLNSIITEEVFINDNFFIVENFKLAFLFFENIKELNPNLSQNYFLELINENQANGIQLIIILESQWLNKQIIIKSRIVSILGKVISIHGRKTKFVRIDKQKAEDFLNENHLQGYVSSKLKYGLYFQNELIAVATFSAGRKMKNMPEKYRSFELIRFANKLGYRVVGGLSKLIMGFLNEREVGDVMTYVDRAWGQGKGFEKIGFVKKGELPPFVIDNIWNAGSLKLVLETNYQLTNSQTIKL